MRVKGTLMRTAVVGQFTNLDGAARVATADGHTAAGGDGVGDVGKEGENVVSDPATRSGVSVTNVSESGEWPHARFK